MAVYQGAAHLEAQLESMLVQDLMPERLVVHDSGSTDGSLQILRGFAHRAPFEVVVLEGQRPRSGGAHTAIASAFGHAMGQCLDTDYVAFADQDDVWLPNRLSATVAKLETNRSLVLAFGDALLVDAEGKNLGGDFRQWYPVPDGLEHLPARSQFFAHLAQPCVLGAAATVRTTHLRWALPIPRYWLHDRWLAVLASAQGGLAPIEEVVAHYRIHPSQAIGLTLAANGGKQKVTRTLTTPIEAAYKALSLRERLKSGRKGLPVFCPSRIELLQVALNPAGLRARAVVST